MLAPSALPTEAAGYAGVDGVVLEDVSNEELGKARAEAIGAAVRNRALGLLALGGDHSFSLGKYYKSPLQDVLPVKSLVPGKLQRKNVAVELVLDRSGSMINEVGGVPKIAQAQAAARGAVAFLLKHRDQVGIVAFEIKPKTLVPLTTVEPGNVQEIEHKINTLPANGGTNIYKGLAEGVATIEKSKAKERHIILLTDGISEPGSYKQLVPGLKKAKIAVATVALGGEADFKLLKRNRGGHRRQLLPHRKRARPAENLRQRDPPEYADGAPARADRRLRRRPQPDHRQPGRPETAAAPRQRRHRIEAGRRGGAARPGQRPPARPGPRPVAVRLGPGRRLDSGPGPELGRRMARTAAPLPGRGALERARCRRRRR